MPLTRVTDNVVTPGTITPDKLSTGGPTWNSSGILSATGFVGDGSDLFYIGSNIPLDTILSTVTSNYIDGYITAEGFVGDGFGLTNVYPPASVIETSNNFFLIQPKHNNVTVLLNNPLSTTIDIDSSNINFKPGHTTTFVQTTLSGYGEFISSIVFVKDFIFKTKGQFGKCFVTYQGPGRSWTLYGDLSGQNIAPAILNAFVLENNPANYLTLEDGDVLLLE
jgi:hypothetical protein